MRLVFTCTSAVPMDNGAEYRLTVVLLISLLIGNQQLMKAGRSGCVIDEIAGIVTVPIPINSRRGT